MPSPVRVAVGGLAVLAALFVVVGLFELLGRGAAADAALRTHPGSDRSTLLDYYTFLALRDLVIGLLAALSALRLPARRSWARWTGIGAALLVAVLVLLAGAQAGRVTIGSLVGMVLAVVVVASLFTRSATAWLPTRRPAGRA
jgi:multidrug transporter EmrE-like cation transporter